MDQESRDANSLLAELDRGLQSPSIGDQSEAVARFTNLFQRFPLPILVNASFLKLSEAFRCGSNFIRIQICEVLERNQSHLNKIYNIEDFYRNIFTPTTSNDPIARSITLLTLVNIVTIVSNYKSIHHYISSSLESNVDCELKATISCAAAFVKHSQEFACNIYPKIVSIIDSSKSTTDIKIRALSVLDHGFYNANDAMTVRLFLIDVMEKSKLKKLICTCLTLSTKIAYTSLSHIMAQIELLLKTFLNDNRLVIQTNALKNLRFLAEKSPHIWESSHVVRLVTHLESILESEITQNDSDDSKHEFNEKCSVSILSIFCKLLTCKCNFISQQEKNRIYKQCYKLSLSNNNIPLCSMAFELLAIMSEERTYTKPAPTLANDMIDSDPTDSDLSENTLATIRAFIDNSTAANSKVSKTKLDSKAIYRHIVKLCSLNPDYSAHLLEIVFKRISSKDMALKDLCPYLTELMCAILQFTPNFTITPENCWKLIKTRGAEMSDTNLLNLCVLYFQILRLKPGHSVAEGLVDKVIPSHCIWFGYKLMRQAMRYGHHKIAGLICTELHEHVTADTTDFYFKSLSRICNAESILLQDQNLDLNLRTALPLYEEAVSPLRASIGNTQRTSFQLQFLCLRIRNLQAHSTLRQCCKVYEASPITYANLLNAIGAVRGGGGDSGLNKSGIIQQMPKIAKEYRYLSDCYENLSVVSFNCDNCTLDHIQLLKSSCVIMADVIDAIFQYGKNLPVISKLPSNTSGQELALEYKELEATCNNLIELIRSEVLNPGINSSPESIQPLIDLLKTFSNELLKCSFVYPRYFFQPLQMTQIKLAITPQPSSSSGSIILTLNFNLVLKVEGLIQNHSKTNKIIREISKVIISVTMVSTKLNEPNINLFFQSTANPSNNYFKTEFLLPLKWAGSFIVDIDVSIIDKLERVWKTGPMERLNLTVS